MALILPDDMANPYCLRYWHIRNTAWDKDSGRTRLVVAGYFSFQDRGDRYPQARDQMTMEVAGNLTVEQAYVALAAAPAFLGAVMA